QRCTDSYSRWSILHVFDAIILSHSGSRSRGGVGGRERGIGSGWKWMREVLVPDVVWVLQRAWEWWGGGGGGGGWGVGAGGATTTTTSSSSRSSSSSR